MHTEEEATAELKGVGASPVAAMYKTVMKEESGQMLGAHLLGPHSEEVINIFGVAIGHGVNSRDLAHTIFGYPTSGSDVPYML